MLRNKKILIAITGSIAIYKILDLISRLKKESAIPAVVLSAKAAEFIPPLAFEAMTGISVLTEDSETWVHTNNIRGPSICSHIEYARWADIILLAPATCNSIVKFNLSLADSVLLSTLLAHDKPILIAPSANNIMLKGIDSQLSQLESKSHEVIPPRLSLLACDVEEVGAMAEPLEIMFRLRRRVLIDHFWKDERVLITGGSSYEDIDPVRCISNHSSGKQAHALALALYYLGAKVTIISSQSLELPLEIKQMKAFKAAEFLQAIKKEISKNNYLFMLAAICDVKPLSYSSNKINKSDLQNINLIKNIDILESLKDINIFKVGFKLETLREGAKERAKNALESKHLNIICLNIIDENNILGGDNNALTCIFNDGKEIDINQDNKLNIGFKLAKLIQDYATKNH